ncbi:MAG: 2-oxoglutarate dehydrogenase, subunit [Streptosporangiaceae bacterium]|nr:2-oxoglutarate dehydrogenase, subunit [Streptosporangiaceae bacterium]
MSTESSRTPADLSKADFGPNEWLVDELYQKYLEDPNSVDRAWWNFFADYQPDSRPAKKASLNGAVATSSSPPCASAPAPAK